MIEPARTIRHPQVVLARSTGEGDRSIDPFQSTPGAPADFRQRIHGAAGRDPCAGSGAQLALGQLGRMGDGNTADWLWFFVLAGHVVPQAFILVPSRVRRPTRAPCVLQLRSSLADSGIRLNTKASRVRSAPARTQSHAPGERREAVQPGVSSLPCRCGTKADRAHEARHRRIHYRAVKEKP
jgi:hypothetical protein